MRKEHFLKWLIPLLVIMVAVWQFYMVYSYKLTRWKGGGYGMYSEVHPQLRQVWVKVNDTLRQVNTASGYPKTWENKAVKLCYRPNDQNLKNFASLYAKKFNTHAFTIQVWQPAMDVKQNLFFRTLVNEVHYVAP